MEKDAHALEPDVMEQMTSPEFLASLPCVDRIVLDPMSFGFPEFRGEEYVTPASKTARPFGPQVPDEGRDGAEGPQDEEDGAPVPGFRAVLPEKRPFDSLAKLSSELTRNQHRLHQGLHPDPFGVAQLTGRGVEQGRGRGILGRAGLLPGWQESDRKMSPNFQQVMSPTCEKDLPAFGTSSASSSQVTLREKAPKRYKEGPIDEGEQKVNLLDLKKEIKEELAKEIKADYGKYITQIQCGGQRGN